mgnify:FL=1
MRKKVCGNCFATMRGNVCRHCGYRENSTKPEYDALSAGTELHGRYIIGRLLGKGGFGMIYLAYDQNNDRAVAVKEYYPDGTAVRSGDNVTVEPMTTQQAESFDEGKKRFEQEAELISHFRESSEMIGIYDVFEENGSAYYAMDFVRGASLKDIVAKAGKLSPQQAVYIAVGLLPALEIMHREMILHRDVSPDNIMLCPDGSVKLIDFGAARQLGDSTQSMSVILKQGFAPLEQYQRKGRQGGWTDIYSLGASLYFALTGETPDDPLTRLEDDSLFKKGLTGVTCRLAEVLVKACALKSEERYQDAGEMLNAVKSCGISSERIPEEIIASVISGNDSRLKRPGRRRTVITAAAAAVTIAAGSAVAFLSGIWAPPVEVKIGGEMFPVTVTELDLSDRELTNSQISNLRHMKQLKYLNLKDNYITDLSCLAPLTQLESLHFSNNNVTDISFMKNMDGLREISAENTGVSDISVLRGKTQLESVFFGDSYVTDITPISDSRGLRYVGFNEAQIPDINALEGMTELETVCFAGCGITSLEPLRSSKKLRNIYFGRNNISDLSPLIGCDIEEMYIDCNQLNGDTEAFRGLTAYGFIVLNGNGYPDSQLDYLVSTINGEFTLYN